MLRVERIRQPPDVKFRLAGRVDILMEVYSLTCFVPGSILGA
jgi:hypothetical protein